MKDCGQECGRRHQLARIFIRDTAQAEENSGGDKNIINCNFLPGLLVDQLVRSVGSSC